MKNQSQNHHNLFSPRGQFAIKPNWNKDILFRISGGIYAQPPMYRELRDSLGIVRSECKSAKVNPYRFRK